MEEIPLFFFFFSLFKIDIKHRSKGIEAERKRRKDSKTRNQVKYLLALEPVAGGFDGAPDAGAESLVLHVTQILR